MSNGDKNFITRKATGLIYLACPYTHKDPAVREARFKAVSKKTAEFLRNGINVFSPITHSHPLVEYELPVEWSFWEKYDKAFLDVCDRLFVYMLDGWEESKGVRAEIEYMIEQGKPIIYLEVD